MGAAGGRCLQVNHTTFAKNKVNFFLHKKLRPTQKRKEGNVKWEQVMQCGLKGRSEATFNSR